MSKIKLSLTSVKIIFIHHLKIILLLILLFCKKLTDIRKNHNSLTALLIMITF